MLAPRKLSDHPWYGRLFELIYVEEFKTREEARAREKYLKSYKGAKEKLSILENL